MKGRGTIDIGPYSFTCIETPGHTPGHMCLYEPDKRIFISGDHILSDITPNIAFWPEMEDSLRRYLASLDKVYPMDIDIVLPGHRSVFHDHKKRIRELIQHHQSRASEIMLALEQGEKTAFEIAPHMSWDIECSSWREFHPSQKWFAMGETVAHLKYLEGNNLVLSRKKRQTVLFQLK